MTDEIKTGTILIRDGTILPDALRFESKPCATGWRLIKNVDGYGLDRKIREAGWTFFYLAGEIKGATIFGFDVQKTARRAVKRILANLKPEKFNSLEITRIVSKHILGVPCTKVYALSRHVQQSMVLFRDQDSQMCDQTKTPCDVNPRVVRAKGQILPLEEISTQPAGATP